MMKARSTVEKCLQRKVDDRRSMAAAGAGAPRQPVTPPAAPRLVDLEAGALERVGCQWRRLGGDVGDHGEQQLPELGVVRLEDLDDLGVADRLDPGGALEAHVVVGDERDV